MHAKSQERAAVIDIGTNSILLLVADLIPSGTEVRPVTDRAIITRLGKGVDSRGRLSAESITRSLEAVSQYAHIARAEGAERIVAIGTSALRDAANAAEFLEPAAAAIGSPVDVIAGEREARLSWYSVAFDGALALKTPALMADVGGGSTELVAGSGEDLTSAVSVDIGAVRLTERCLQRDPCRPEDLACARKETRAALSAALQDKDVRSLAGIGGTIVNLANILSGGAGHELTHGSRLSASAVTAITERLAALPLAERQKTPGLECARADVIVAGGIIFETLLSITGLADVVCSTHGARFGALIRHMRGLP